MLPLPGILRRLDEEDLAARRRPREPRRDARVELVRSASSGVYLCGPRTFSTSSGVTTSLHVLALGEPHGDVRGTPRAISRSRPRTPASRV